MASSSSHTYSLSSSGSSSSPDFSGLPIHLLRGKIIQKIQENRVTLIVGETGCGKSSQVPQFLLEENMEPVLCTQPRRFAVVAVARMVAKARNCEVGEEVGYHIGHSKVLSDRSKIVFKTAGVLLDEMREKGLKALKYKVIILDEVHERSVESDLVLVCVKQFLLKQNDMRVVLMSATADIARYREYFKDLGKDERVEVLAIPSSPQHTIYQQKVSYLEQITELLGMSSQSLALKYCSGPRPSLAKAEMKPEVHELIHELVLHIHKNEPDMEKSILVFLPTYQSLVHQWASLKRFVTAFKIHILHSSIDIEQALKAMKISESHRKVILATNIAESSVTIPKVAYVIDSCRSLQVFWDHNRKNDASDFVWISKSQADQRKGRTGRTCDGHVYRLVTGSFFNQLQVYESPAILRLSLTQQVLLLCCSESKAISDPKVLLQKALDAPDLQVVEDALSLLVRVRALEKISPRGRYEPTFYGRLLASFSLSFDASVLILKFGKLGMPREGILLGILMDTQPLPILRPFGQDDLFAEYNESYYSGDCRKTGLTGRKEVSFMGNLSAFLFWQHVFKDKHRLERLKEIFKCDETEVSQIPPHKIEEEWCSSHNLVQSSLHHIAEIYENVLNTLHRFRPNILVTSGLPFNYDPYESQHTCILKCERNEDEDEDGDVLAIDDDEHPDQVGKIGKCIAVPFVDNQIQLDEVAESLGNIIKEVRVQYIEDTAGSHQDLVKGYDDHESGEAPICRYFVSGMCNRGSQCSFSHSLQATKPVCKFFLSLQGCRNGDSCFFSHDAGSMPLSYSSSNFCLPEEFYADVSSLLHLFPAPSNGCILLLNDNGFRFTANLARLYDPASIICTTSSVDGPTSDSSLAGVRILTGLSHPYHTIFDGPGESSIPWNQVKCVLWFPTFEGFDGKRAVQTFFEHLAVRILADALYDVQVILTMNNIRFSQLQVEKLGRESFFVLRESFPYDESSFGPLPDAVTFKKPMVVSKPVCYVFCLRPPTHINLGDYATVLRQRLRSIQ